MPDLEPAIEQRLADLSDTDWAALTARVRPPSSAAQLKEIAGKHITGDRLEAFVSVANLKALAAENGDIDETKVVRALSTLFGVPADSGPTHADFGQGRPPAPIGPGDRGRAEAARRFGPTSADAHPSARGAAGRAEAQRRFGRKELR
jgi:hypothetical protein